MVSYKCRDAVVNEIPSSVAWQARGDILLQSLLSNTTLLAKVLRVLSVELKEKRQLYIVQNVRAAACLEKADPTLRSLPSYWNLLTVKTATFPSSFFNWIVKPWDIICNITPHDKLSSLSMFKYFLRSTYFTLLDTNYNTDMPCTWFSSRNWPCHCS